MAEVAKLELNGKTYELPVVVGTEGQVGLDISRFYKESGAVMLDDGYGNTASCKSAITYIDGDKGILRYRGIPIEQLAEKSSFVETAWLVIWGRLPTAEEAAHFSEQLTLNAAIHEDLHHHYDGFPAGAPPMAILSAMINALSCYHGDYLSIDEESRLEAASARLISQVRTLAAASYRKSIGAPMNYPRRNFKYCENFLHMMFSNPYDDYIPDPEVARALNLFLILHADHEQNCSTSTVRMVASSGANLFTSCAAGVSALWGPLHGGANVAVIEMLKHISESGMRPKEFLEKVKNKENHIRLMGFGHRVYRNFDPRSKILREAAYNVLAKLHKNDELLDIAQELSELALRDDYFVERKLYPNVDFYSGTLLRAIGIPVNMFTVLFAIGRIPGWIAHWRENHSNPHSKINRPRQIYLGKTLNDYVPRDKR